MKDIKYYLSKVLSKFIPAFRKIETVLADKEMSNNTKVKAIKWLILQLDAELADDGRDSIESYVENTNCNENFKHSEYCLLNKHDFNAEIFLN